MLPEGWKNISLMKLADKISDGIHTTPEYADGTGLYFINGNNLKNGRISIGLSTKSVNESEFKKHKKDLTERTLLISINGTIGNIAFYNGEPVILGKSAAYVNIKNEVSKDYVYYFLTSDIIQKYFTNEVTGSTIRNLSLGTIKQTPTPLPPLAEQRKIAEILSVWDHAIEVVEKLIANAKAQKKALMQTLLTGKKRLPGFKGEWRTVKLAACANSQDNKRVPLNGEQRQAMQGAIPYYGANGIVGYVNDHIFDEPLVLLAEDGGYFDEYETRPIAQLVKGKSWVNNHAHILTSKRDTKTEWIYYSLVHRNILDFVNGGTRAKLNKSDMLQIPMHLPAPDEQEAICNVLSKTELCLDNYKMQLSHLNSQKSALMQQLLTGKRRVKVEGAL